MSRPPPNAQCSHATSLKITMTSSGLKPPRDNVSIRAGVSHRWYNTTGEPAEVFFGVAPRYR